MHENAQSVFSRGDIDNPYLFTFGVTTVRLLEELRGEMTIIGDTGDGEEELYQRSVPLHSFTAGGLPLKNSAMLKKRMYVMDSNALVNAQADTTVNAIPPVYKENDYIVGIGPTEDDPIDFDTLPADITLRVKILHEKEVLKEEMIEISKAPEQYDIHRSLHSASELHNINQYNIYTWRDLQHIDDDLRGNYMLQNDIVFPEVGHYGYENFSPIGWFASDTGHPVVVQKGLASPLNYNPNHYFSGVLDGNNHNIEGLYINYESRDNIGLFAFLRGLRMYWIEELDTRVNLAGIIRNVTIYHAGITGRNNVGVLLGFLVYGGLIENVHVQALNGATVSGKNGVGGFMGSTHYAGAIMPMTHTSARTDVKGKNNVGGLIGYSDLTKINNGYATGKVEGTKDVGGLVGKIWQTGYATVIGYATGHVTGERNVGGLLGFAGYQGAIWGYAAGDVKGDTNVGGIIGHAQWGWTNGQGHNVSMRAYSTGDVMGRERISGGIGYITKYAYSSGGRPAKYIIDRIVGYARGTVYTTDGSRSGLLVGDMNNDGQAYNIDGYFSVSNAELSGQFEGINGVSIDISTVTDENYQDVFDTFTFGDKAGQWTWLGAGTWPAINIGDIAPAVEQPIGE